MAGERAACIAPDNVWVLFNCSLDFLAIGKTGKAGKDKPPLILAGLFLAYYFPTHLIMKGQYKSHLRFVRKIAFRL